jgi:hypothetical protein
VRAVLARVVVGQRDDFCVDALEQLGVEFAEFLLAVAAAEKQRAAHGCVG